MLCLGREPTKTEHLGEKNFPFSQMLFLGREPTKTEHLGKKISPVGTQVLETRVLTGNFFFPPDALFL